MANSPQVLLALQYTYVEDMLERRVPHREAHLTEIRAWADDGRVIIAGAIGDPPHGAIIAFDCEKSEVERFVAADPYFVAGLVTEHRIDPWTISVHGAPAEEE